MSDTYGSGVYGTAVYSSSPVTLPSNTVAPELTGTLTIGSTLTCSSGTWTDSSHVSYDYQWQDSTDAVTWGNISSETDSTYVIPSGEAFKFIRCIVTDTDANGSATATSNEVGVIYPAPANTALPAISGTAQVGAVLSATSGTWTDDGSPVFTYQWQDSPDGSTGWGNIATGPAYFVEPSRGTEYLRCIVTNTDAGGATQATSDPIGPVVSAPTVGLSLIPFQQGTLVLIPIVPSP